jgi:hypothetical protein
MTIHAALRSLAKLDAVQMAVFVVWGLLSVEQETVLLLAMQNQIAIQDMDPNGPK